MSEDKKNVELPIVAPITRTRSNQVVIFLAALALVVSLTANFFNYLFTDSVHSDTQKQKLELKKLQADIGLVASNMTKKIDDDHQLLDAQIASLTGKFEKQRTQIESQRGQTERIHRTIGFNKLFNDLRPSIEIDCQRSKIYTTKISKNTIPIDCSFKNLGTLKASIIPVTLIMTGGENYKDIDGAIERIDNNEANSVLPGKIKGSRYYVVLTEFGAANLKKAASFKIRFRAFTDVEAISLIKQRTNETITDKELKNLSEKNYAFTFQL